MFTRYVVALAAATILLSGAAYAQDPAIPPAQPPSVNQRLERQKDRIKAGVADDQLTKQEAARAARRDRAIHIKELKDRQANGGTLTPQEKAQLDRALDRNSRRIARERHNNVTPPAQPLPQPPSKS
jgi:hypothetical protein